MKQQLSNIHIVLVNPDESGNIGSVCRAMKAMGISNLDLVSSKTYDEEKIRIFSVHAFEIYKNAHFFSTLNEALDESVLSAGFSRRKGKKRKYFSYIPEQIAQKALMLKGKVCFVFGNEEHGLTEEELSLCTAAVLIPTSPEFPSLNLAQAVQIAVYELYRQTAKTSYEPISRKNLDILSKIITDQLVEIGFCTRGNEDIIKINKESLTAFFRDILGRAGVSITEGNRLRDIFIKIKNLHKSGNSINQK